MGHTRQKTHHEKCSDVFNLKKIDPSAHPLCELKEQAQREILDMKQKIYDLLYLMYAHGKYSLLIILQGIDASGKDGTVRHIFSAANPQGIKVFSFKKPTEEESKHDFLWRCHLHTPASGLTTIFNRSYYEEVTTVRVHPEYLAAQNIPSKLLHQKDFFKHRYESINHFEKMLTNKGTTIIKFFLHISKAEQKIRLQDRIKNLSKNWKFSMDDIKERQYWNQYMKVYSEMLQHTSTKHCPWVIVPANNKWYRDYVVFKTILEQLVQLSMSFPKKNLNEKDFLSHSS